MTSPAAARAAGPGTCRALNDRFALDLLLSRGPLTASQLAELTGLSRPTVADLVDRLRRTGLVEVVGEAGADRRGPNARLYGLAAARAHIAGLDVRVDGITIAVADLTGRTVATSELALLADPRHELGDAGQEAGPGHEGADPHRERDGCGVVAAERRAGTGDAGDRLPGSCLSRAMDAFDAVVREAGVTTLHTVAIGAPGLVDPATGVLVPATGHPGWHAELSVELRRRGHRVLLENEVNLAGLAERRLGATLDRDTFVLLWLGEGVGAATILDDRLRRGASGGAGELGFLPVPGATDLPTADACHGGFYGAVSAPAVLELAERTGVPVPGDRRSAAAAVATATQSTDAASVAFLDALALRIAIGVSAVCVVLDPGCVVLGGDLGRAGGAVLAERVAREVAMLSPLRTEIRSSGVSGNVVLQGAVLIASDEMHSDLFPGA